MKRFQGFPLQLIPHSPQQAGNKTNLQDEELHSYHQHWFTVKTQDAQKMSNHVPENGSCLGRGWAYLAALRGP